ncbi:MAG: hypothetical protein LBB88_01445 [Planctomycetaceae bacterium]|nr:hypothetical protein [Planctomycetaceae bacterium]
MKYGGNNFALPYYFYIRLSAIGEYSTIRNSIEQFIFGEKIGGSNRKIKCGQFKIIKDILLATMENSSDIRDILERIHELQLQLAELNGRLRRGMLLLKSQTAAIQKNETTLQTVTGEYNKLYAYAKQKELEVAQNDQNLAKRKEQLREAKTNKEYQALLSQISADEAARSVLDDEALEAIEKAEKFHANVNAAEQELKKSQELFEKTKKKYYDDKPKIDADIISIGESLNVEEVKLPREFKEIYDRLKRNFAGGESLAVVENQSFCGACNHQIPINSLAMIMQKKPITCSSCARLLYIPKDFVFERG